MHHSILHYAVVCTLCLSLTPSHALEAKVTGFLGTGEWLEFDGLHLVHLTTRFRATQAKAVTCVHGQQRCALSRAARSSKAPSFIGSHQNCRQHLLRLDTAASSVVFSGDKLPATCYHDGKVVGVLALQGSYREHAAHFQRCGVRCIEVRKPEHLVGLSGLVIPGGESTTIANVAERIGLTQPLQEFVRSGRPVWGTCAGLIFLANNVLGQKKGGQSLIGGLDVTCHRNFFGSQVNSFEADIPVPVSEDGAFHAGDAAAASSPCRAVFIRAPAILRAGPGVDVLAEYKVDDAAPPAVDVDGVMKKFDKVIVAVRQNHILATAFHPELTKDLRWHRAFIALIEKFSNVEYDPSKVPTEHLLPFSRPGDIPIYCK
eukprot:jgi/Mesvir1/12853/Mv05882-RA.1